MAAALAAMLSLLGCGQYQSSWDGLPNLQSKVVESVPDQIIVKYKAPPGDHSAALAPEEILPAQPRSSLPGSSQLAADSFDSRDDTVLVRVPGNWTAEAFALEYSKLPEVEWALPNLVFHAPQPPSSTTSDPLPFQQLNSSLGDGDPLIDQQWFLSRVHAQQAWQSSTGAGVLVAVVDTGVDYNHPDLAGGVELGADYVDNLEPKDQNGHGTHVAGIVAARHNNGIGGAGIAPDAKVLAVRVLDASGKGSLFAIARGIKYAADYGRRVGKHVVINLSLGSSASIDPVDFVAGWYAALRGALLCAAAGNSGGAIDTPANIKYFMAVAATDEQDHRAAFSNYGPKLAISAPGVHILSTTPTYPVTLNQLGFSTYYAKLSGTSMATPMVSGVAALVWAKHPDWSASKVRAALLSSAHKQGPSSDLGAGIVDASAALAAQ